MRRSGFTRKQGIGGFAPRTRMKSKRKPLTKIQAAARDQECTLRFPFGICNYRIDTTVLCHSNQLEDGKGAGLKAPDTAAAFGCCACHDVLDGRAPRPAEFSYALMLELFGQAVGHTHRILRRLALLPAAAAP